MTVKTAICIIIAGFLLSVTSGLLSQYHNHKEDAARTTNPRDRSYFTQKAKVAATYLGIFVLFWVIFLAYMFS
jgi:hypothetical protein